MIVVDVRQSDIDEGKKANCQDCPVARAVSRAVGEPAEVYGSRRQGGLVIKAGGRWTKAPTSVGCFVHFFDQGAHCRPFTFELPERHSKLWSGRCPECNKEAPELKARMTCNYCPQVSPKYVVVEM